MAGKMSRAVLQGSQAALRDLQFSYSQVLGQNTPAQKNVLTDLMEYCHWGATPFSTDERETLVMVGRQQVILRIMQMMHLPDHKAFELFTGLQLPVVQLQPEDITE